MFVFVSRKRCTQNFRHTRRNLEQCLHSSTTDESHKAYAESACLSFCHQGDEKIDTATELSNGACYSGNYVENRTWIYRYYAQHITSVDSVLETQYLHTVTTLSWEIRLGCTDTTLGIQICAVTKLVLQIRLG